MDQGRSEGGFQILGDERCPRCGGQVATGGTQGEDAASIRWCIGGGWQAEAQGCGWGDE